VAGSLAKHGPLGHNDASERNGAGHDNMTKRAEASAWLDAGASELPVPDAAALLKRKLRFEQVRNLYAVTQYSYRTSIIFAVLVFLNFYTRVPYFWLLGWFLAVSGIAVGRYLVAKSFLRLNPPEAHCRRWALIGIGLVALQAVGWIAVLAMVEYTRHTMDVAFAVFLVCALAFGGLASFSFFLPAYLVFAVPLFGALWIWLLALGGGDSLWLAVTVAFGSLATFDAAFNSTRLIRRSLELGHEREELLRRLNDEKELAQVTLRSIGDSVLTADVDGAVTSLNPVAERLTGWRQEEARGRRLMDVLQLQDESSGARVPDLVRLCRDRQGLVVLEEETLLSHRSGDRESVVEVLVSPIRNHDRKMVGVVVVLRDVTELRGMARVVSFQASHDPLTGLANRRAFEAHLWHAMESARHERREHAICYLDLDQFKLVNDTCGHIAGDELLKQVTELLLKYVRETDTLARLGGDEFGLLLYGCGLRKASQIADDICTAMREFRFEWESKAFTVGASIGLVPLDAASTPSGLLAAADAACYVAKDRGRNRVHIAHARDQALANRHGEMEWTMHVQRALDNDLFQLRYQRILPLDAGGEVLAEILLSLNGPDGRATSPMRFLPAAERFNMMPNIDRRVVRMVFERVRDGGSRLDGISRFNINLSGQSLSDEGFLDYVLQQLTATAIDPCRICFEITETAVIANLPRAKRFISALRTRGCTFALDDFGSGLSSFGYLRTLPVEYLKIDGLFVKHMSADAIDHSMVEAINQVGHVMGIKTIAEYVEDEATLQALRKLGVDYAQGFALHRPEWFD
jgi:diguanylate cyclase (GGDEF)-like protein/PAS domain S-box-containing protein